MNLRKHAPLVTFLAFTVLVSTVVFAQKLKEIKPAVSESQVPVSEDIKIAEQIQKEAPRQFPLIQNPEIQRFLDRVINRLVSHPEAGEYPYKMQLIYEPSINAFAYPGGAMFVHTGLITAADNEEQVAGVLAHEASHVALRHGIGQMLKAQRMQTGAGIASVLAGIFLGQGAAGSLAQMGIGMGAQTLMLKNSREAEKDADLLGARLMNQSGYNPIEMARFFEKLDAEGGGSRAPEWFSDHPNPGNRVEYVEEEIQALPQRKYDAANEREFQQVKRAVSTLKAPPKPAGTKGGGGPASGGQGGGQGQGGGTYQGRLFQMAVPQGWQVYGDRRDPDQATFAPQNGIRQNQVVFGVVVSHQQTGANLRRSTETLINDMRNNNRGLRVGRQQNINVGGTRGLLTEMTSESALGGTEIDTLVTAIVGGELFSAVFVAPQQNMQEAQPIFRQMLASLRLAR